MNANQNRVALVTGSGRGLGRAIAERLGKDGTAIVIADIDAGIATATAAELCAAGIDATAVALDVADEASVAAAFAMVDEKFGRLDILVNNAGILGLVDGKRPLVEEMSLALWRQTLEVNLTGVFLASRAAIPLMKRGKWGRIVNIASRAARMRSGLGNSNYAASKAGIIGFSRVLAGEVGKDGVTVNCIAPSRIATAMTVGVAGGEEWFRKSIADSVVGRLATPMDVAETAAFLCSDAAGFVTGIIMDVNGGSFMP